MNPRPPPRWLLYGAYGFTGRLIAEVAARRGASPVLAGRDEERTRRLALKLGLEARTFALESPSAIREGTAGVEAVLNAAGPFSSTYRPVLEACIWHGTHYLDLTGEIDVLEALRAEHARAQRARMLVLPGVGFDVVPTDCAAARAVERVPTATRLEIAFRPGAGPSRGTARTILESLDRPARERRDGRIVDLEGVVSALIPFSDRSRPALAVSWGDVSTAHHSTGVPNVRTYVATSRSTILMARLIWPFLPFLARPRAVALMRQLVDRFVRGPESGESESRVWCRARDGAGAEAVEELVTPGAYAFTAQAAVAAVEKLLAPDYQGPKAGFATPSGAFGAGFAEEIDGVRRVQGRSP